MRVLVDTNILLRSAQLNHPLCAQATYMVESILTFNSNDFTRYNHISTLHPASVLDVR